MRRPTWKGTGAALVCVLACGFVLYQVAMHVLVWREARWAATRPGAALRLTPLDRTSMLSGRSTAVQVFGWTLAIPGNPVVENDGKTFKTFRVPDNGSVAVILPGPGAAAMYRPNPTMRRIFSESELSSEFAFTKAEIDADPGEVSFWNSRIHNARLMELLALKSMLGVDATALHPVGGGHVHGFEEVMQRKGTAFRIRLFGPRDERIELLCRAPANVDPQAWVNVILDGVQPPANSQFAAQ